MLSVVTYLWTPDAGSKFSSYKTDDVRCLQRMVARHLPVPHQFICVTDHPELFAGDAGVRAVRIDWTSHVPGTCFVRLFTFNPQAKTVLGDRVLQLDLDTVIVGDLTSIIDRDEPLVLWRNPRKWALTFPEVKHAKKLSWFNSSVILHSPGTMGAVWHNFDPNDPGARDDQWLISDYAGQNNPYFDQSHGVYRLAPLARRHIGVYGELPTNAKIVNFPGGAAKHVLNDDLASNPWIAGHRTGGADSAP